MGDEAVPAQHDDPGIGADERRAHQRHDDQDMHQMLAGHVVAGHQVGDGNADQRGKQDGVSADLQGIQQGAVIVLALKELREVGQRDATDAVGEEALDDDVVERIDDEDSQRGENEHLDVEPEVGMESLSRRPCTHKDNTSPLSAA